MKKRNIMILVFMLVIGFAAVSTTLVINGTLNIGYNEENFSSSVVYTLSLIHISEPTRRP